MPSKDSVFWINSPDEMIQMVKKALNTDANKVVVENAQKWFEKINQHPPQMASERIWNAINEISKKQC